MVELVFICRQFCRQHTFGLVGVFAAGVFLNYLPAVLYHRPVLPRHPTYLSLGNRQLEQLAGPRIFFFGQLLNVRGCSAATSLSRSRIRFNRRRKIRLGTQTLIILTEGIAKRLLRRLRCRL